MGDYGRRKTHNVYIWRFGSSASDQIGAMQANKRMQRTWPKARPLMRSVSEQ